MSAEVSEKLMQFFVWWQEIKMKVLRIVVVKKEHEDKGKVEGM